MSSPRFVSPGAMAGNAIEEFFVKRAMDERQRVEDEFRRRQAEEAAQRQAQQLALQQQQEARIAEAQRQQQADLEKERSFRRATTIASTALPGDVVDDPTAALLREQGYGSQIRQGQPTQGAYLGEDDASIPQYAVTPGVLQMRGGQQYLGQRAAAEERAAQAQMQQVAAAERAAADRSSREMIASIAAGGQAESRGIRNQLTQMQIDREKEKLETTRQQKQSAEDAITTRKRDINAVLNDLLDEGGGLRSDVAGVIGALDARTPDVTEGANTALSRIDRLMGLLDVNTLNELKRQSPTGATGFGALSEKELAILESASAALRNRKVSEGAYAKELQRIRETVKEGGTGIVNQGPAVGTRRMIRGRLAEWDGNGWLAVK